MKLYFTKKAVKLVSSKQQLPFSIAQVAYSAGDFLSKNRSTLSQSARQMLLHSGNPVVRALGAVLPDETR